MAVSTPHNNKIISLALGVDKKAPQVKYQKILIVFQSPLQCEGEGVWVVWTTRTPGCSLGP